jgi:hypothetical protein
MSAMSMLFQWSIKMMGLALVGLISLIVWHMADMLINRKRNLMHVAGPPPLPVLGKTFPLLFVLRSRNILRLCPHVQ